MQKSLKAPFPYFGGKGAIASVVWDYLGDVEKYIEPFCGSAAVLLSRPWDDRHANRYKELINDKAFFVANFWRALTAEPDEVARYCDLPINEADLHSRQLWLIGEGSNLLKQCETDDVFYNTKAAGYWAWGASCWIGSNWATDGRHAKPNMTPRGVNRLTLDDWDIEGIVPVNLSLHSYLGEIARRLRRVRVLCGDWSRTLKSSEVTEKKTVGIFLDPPYLDGTRHSDLYYHDNDLNVEVQRWCADNQDKARIVLAGYEGEYDLPEWDIIEWTGKRAFASSNSTKNIDNRKLERLWISPLCIKREDNDNIG